MSQAGQMESWALLQEAERLEEAGNLRIGESQAGTLLSDTRAQIKLWSYAEDVFRCYDTWMKGDTCSHL